MDPGSVWHIPPRGSRLHLFGLSASCFLAAQRRCKRRQALVQLGSESCLFSRRGATAPLALVWCGWGTKVLAEEVKRQKLVPETAKALELRSNGRLVGTLSAVNDPQTYSALLYKPDKISGKVPLLVVLHGAGSTNEGVWELADPNGCHGGLPPSLLASGSAPPDLAENFAMVAPYAAAKTSFIREPKERLLQFVNWVCMQHPEFDVKRTFIFGYSDGATVGVQLAASGRFAGGVFAATGGVGSVALDFLKLKNIPLWFFHCADDGILPVRGTDQLVELLRKVSTPGRVRYTRYDEDQEGYTGFLKGHSVGITASKQPEIYKWFLSL